MPLEQLLALAGFVIVMTATPGPNNMMLLSSGANFGFRRSVPHILGITVGCQILLLAVALGLGQVLLRYPLAALVLKVLCIGAILYLAWQLMRSPGPTAIQPRGAVNDTVDGTVDSVARPLSFWQGVMFQWVNPKAWLMMVTVIATYTQPDTMVTTTAIVALFFAVLGTPLISIWNLFGTSLRTLLQHPARLRAFNAVMALALLGSMYPLLI